jgi:8-oxo-dGTP pyrophosphatase MutT (NUDIX family)
MTDSLTPAAVLIPVYRDDYGDLRVVLVVRGRHGVHGGQLGFPGGKVDAGDTSMLETALREANEEVGLDRGAVDVLAELEPVDARTGFRVHPFIGRVPPDVEWSPRAGEIEGVVTARVADVADPALRQTGRFVSHFLKTEIVAEFVPVEGHKLWGLTLFMLSPLAPRLLAGEWSV